MTRKISLKNSAVTLMSALAVSVASASSGPKIHSLEGSLEKGSTLTVHGEGFSEKLNARPWFVWEADHGDEPRNISRNARWERSLSGEFTDEIVAPNSGKAVRFDHGVSSGAALSGVKVDSDRLFVFRRTYEDFDTSKDFAIKTDISQVEGDILEGQMVTGKDSGATGIVQSVKEHPYERYTIFYEKSGGTINDTDPLDFEYGEVMETETATFVNSEGSSNYPNGIHRTFNFKTFRMWNDEKKNNIYVGAGMGQRFNIMPEYSGSMFWNSNMDKSLRLRPYEWKSEEVFYKASSVGVSDGILDFRMDAEKHYSHNFKMRDESRPGRYDMVYQSQVSNGAQPESYMYYDHLYIDDSWHHVAVCDSDTWSGCSDKAIQIPLAWDDKSIEIEYNPRIYDASDDLYLYVVDAEGHANPDGYPLCYTCPERPRGLTVE